MLNKEIKDAKKEKCHSCVKQADEFIFLIFQPSISGKPFCKKCIKEIKKKYL